jgi:hypothetical protein
VPANLCTSYLNLLDRPRIAHSTQHHVYLVFRSPAIRQAPGQAAVWLLPNPVQWYDSRAASRANPVRFATMNTFGTTRFETVQSFIESVLDTC